MLNWILAFLTAVFFIGFVCAGILKMAVLRDILFVVTMILSLLGCFLNSSYWKARSILRISRKLQAVVHGKGPCIQLIHRTNKHTGARQYTDVNIHDVVSRLPAEVRQAILEAHNAIVIKRPEVISFVPASDTSFWNYYEYTFPWFVVVFWISPE